MSNAGDMAGAIIVVHNQDSMPFPEDEGILLYPGEIAVVGLTKVKDDTMSTGSEAVPWVALK